MSNWTYNGVVFTEEQAAEMMTAGTVGFVYLITNLETGRKYIGKKLIKRVKKQPPLKGKTRKRISVVQSDWQDYWTSNLEIMEEGKTNPERFTRQILVFSQSKGELNYTEAKMQFDWNVLLDDNFYNGIIQCKVHKSHLKNLKKEFTDNQNMV